MREGERIMTICNACRYCEGFCAVFPAMERRRLFSAADLNHLANLCHNCTECLHACQYAAPHPFAVNVPLTLARIRRRSYEQYCWPRALGAAFAHHEVATVLGIAGLLCLVMIGASRLIGQRPLLVAGQNADFYAVVPHGVMVALFGGVFLLVVGALVIGVVRYLHDTGGRIAAIDGPSILAGLRDAATLTYLHGSGDDCTAAENSRTPWRRRWHHLTVGGFALCGTSTTVAAIYHGLLGWEAPYALVSVPVLLGTIGGIGLVVGPVGLWVLRDRRDPTTMDPDQRGLDASFVLLLLMTSVTGLALLVFRESAAMGLLLIVHLAVVLTLFVTLPYGKFVHGLYRTAALIQHAREGSVGRDRSTAA
ncbi:MAG: tricarballylate utilization 4Fe-4S protein TcuB [Vicinamibacterales bacterium]